MTAAKALNKAEHSMQSSSTSPRLDAEILLAYVLKRQRSWLIAHVDIRLLPWQRLRFWWLINQHQQGLPVAYLTHIKEFYGRQFYLNRHVLIPRPETELLVEQAIHLIKANQEITTVVDVGTGSGCIGISLALELPQIQVVALDSSLLTLRVARLNAKRSGVFNRITFLRGDLIQPLLTTNYSLLPNSILVANLPYLTTVEVQDELTREPRIALDGGADGLKLYRRLIDQLISLPPTSRPHWLILELHPPTWPLLSNMIRCAFPAAQITVQPDLNQQPRVAVIEFLS